MVIHGDQRRLFDLRDFGVSVVLAGVSLIDVDDNGGLFFVDGYGNLVGGDGRIIGMIFKMLMRIRMIIRLPLLMIRGFDVCSSKGDS